MSPELELVEQTELLVEERTSPGLKLTLVKVFLLIQSYAATNPTLILKGSAAVQTVLVDPALYVTVLESTAKNLPQKRLPSPTTVLKTMVRMGSNTTI